MFNCTDSGAAMSSLLRSFSESVGGSNGGCMALRAVALGLIAAMGLTAGASAQSGSCCLPSGSCVITTSATVCANTTNKGVWVGNAACTAGLLGDCYPDVFVYDLQDAWRWGSLAVGGKTMHAFSFG